MEFVAKVHKLGINPCVNVPERIVNALLSDARKQSGPVQVKGTLNGAIFEANVSRMEETSSLKWRIRQRNFTEAWGDIRKNSFNGRNRDQQRIFHGQSPLGSDVQEDRKKLII